MYCTDPELPDSGENPENASGHPQGVAGGWGPTSKVWGRHDVLSVYFHNPDILKRWKCGDSTMDVNGILGWAGEWNSKTPHVPTFERIDSSKRAHIRVTFEGKKLLFSLFYYIHVMCMHGVYTYNLKDLDWFVLHY